MKTFFYSFAIIVILFFFGMLYWSSKLIEEDLKVLKIELGELKRELKEAIKEIPKNTSEERPSKKVFARPHIDSHFPNLLQEDPFFKSTLPSLLGTHFRPSGTFREALLGKPDHLHPFNAFKDFVGMTYACTGSLAQLQFGKYETFSPFFAIKIEKRPRKENPDLFEYWIHLRENVFWEKLHPKHFPATLSLSSHFLKSSPLTAHDFKFFYDAVMNPYVAEGRAGALRRPYSNIEAFEVIDDLTFVIRWKQEKYSSFNSICWMQPLPSFVYKYFADGKKIIEDEVEDTYRTSSIWAQNFSNHFAKNVIVSCGPYLFSGMNEEGIKFVRNPNFYDPYAALIEEHHYVFKESADAMWQDFKAGKIDICTLSPNQLLDYKNFLQGQVYQQQAKNGFKINDLEFVDRSYYYIGWNEKKPYFHNRKIREALTLAIDRRRIIEQNLNHMGIIITGPFFPHSPSYDNSIVPLSYDPDEAIRLLEEEGWYDRDGDGIREKIIDGQRVPFRFSLIYYVKNVSTKVICEYVATTLRKIGIDCKLFGVDLQDLSRSFEDKSFDALFLGWSLEAPPENPEQLWHSSLAEQKGSSNAVGFSNAEADDLIEKLHYEYDAEKRKMLYYRFHKIIYDEAPYTFLYSPKRHLLYRDNVKNLFIPKDRQDLIPGAEVAEPQTKLIWITPSTFQKTHETLSSS